MQDKQSSLKLNFVMNALLTMSSFIFPLVTFPYISRILSPDGIGRVSFATSLISYFNMIAQLGVPTYGIRACAKVRDNKEELTRTVHELLFINMVMSIFSYGVLIVGIIVIPKLYEERILCVTISCTIILSAIGMEWLYKALEQYMYITIRSIIFKFVALIAMFMFIHTEKDYILYGGITILASSASNIFNFINVHNYVDMNPIGNYKIRRHFKAIIVFFAMSCATVIYTNLDTVMLGFMKTNEDVGYYNAAVKIKVILVSIVTSLGTVLLPRASYYIKNGFIDEFKRVSQKALTFVFLLAVPLMVYCIIFARQGIYFLSGTAYKNSVEPMQIIMPTLLFIGITNIFGIQILVPLGKEKYVLYSEIAGAVVDFLLNLILIPKMASKGAAIGTLTAEAVVLILQYIVLKNEITTALKKIHYLNIFFGTVLGSIVAKIVSNYTVGNFFTLFISGIVFFGVYGGFMLLVKEPMIVEALNQIIKILKNKIRTKGNS